MSSPTALLLSGRWRCPLPPVPRESVVGTAQAGLHDPATTGSAPRRAGRARRGWTRDLKQTRFTIGFPSPYSREYRPRTLENTGIGAREARSARAGKRGRKETRRTHMRFRTAAQSAIVGTLGLLPASALAEDTKVNPLMTKELAGLAGKEATILTVEYAPGRVIRQAQAQRAHLRLCPGRLHRHASRRSQRGHARPRSDVL